ncbi:unnamed protein product [Eruca vesicaria subsp. sativa]|uniref:Uncharacterized protein n=1 Tax=Eruca vesicaria subsp. sativa TaxID=29727 RepID=A0ABC8M4S3_ERUVS|nr:unnamed protein product [Eruca vesicaria subsp. sativa]
MVTVIQSNMHGGTDGETTATGTGARGLKKGPWTTTEDAILTEYVRKHGEGNWNAVQKNSGLLRCGKSCRLRWANHLRPNLRKGSFSPDEEKIIIELHAKVGNKWARMASQLPGRTDNEIKNYWNTRTKRRQRSGLPLYPHEIQHQGIDNGDEFEFNSFQFPNQDQPNHRNMIQYTNSSNTPSSSSLFSSSSSQPQKNLCLDPLISTNPSLNQIPNTPMNTHMFSLENDNNLFGFTLPLSSSSSSNEFCYTNKKDIDATSYSSLLMVDNEMTPSSFPLGLDSNVLELPSVQTPTHLLSSNTIFDNGDPLYPHAGNSGLLDTVLEESRVLSRGGSYKDVTISSTGLCEYQDKRVKMDFENRLIDHPNSSHQSSFETTSNLYKRYIGPTIVKATMDDDDILMSLLNNFSSTTAIPDDWYRTTKIQQGSIGVEPHKAPPSSDTVDPLASLGSCYWGGMHSMC